MEPPSWAPEGDAPPLWTQNESQALRERIGRDGARTKTAVCNCAMKYLRRLVTREGGQHQVQSIDVTQRGTAPAGQGYMVPVWVPDSKEKGKNNQAGKVDFTKCAELDLRGVLAQQPSNIFEEWWSGGNQLQKISFELVGELSVSWEVAGAPDIDLVFWGTLRRLHLHPGQNGSCSAMFQGPRDPIAPATLLKKRGKKPEKDNFLIGGQDDPEFMEAARQRLANGLETGVLFWPEHANPFVPIPPTTAQAMWMQHRHLRLLTPPLTSPSLCKSCLRITHKIMSDVIRACV